MQKENSSDTNILGTRAGLNVLENPVRMVASTPFGYSWVLFVQRVADPRTDTVPDENDLVERASRRNISTLSQKYKLM